MSNADTEYEDALAVLAQVVDLGPNPSPRELELGTVVSQQLGARPVPTRQDLDPELAAALRAPLNLRLATTQELLAELATRIEVVYPEGDQP